MDTKVEITVQRGGTQRTLTGTRQNLASPSGYTRLCGHTLVKQVTGFDRDTGDAARSQLQKGFAAGATSLILDLRQNGGGYVTAAQALGRTKNPVATAPLLMASADANELVACAALAALEEALGREESFNPDPSAKAPWSAEVVTGLKTAMVDPRWRVRAAAVAATGKLKITELTPELKRLLEDPDGFVVKSVLVALGEMEAAPDTAELAGLAERMPAMVGEAVAIITATASTETVDAVTKLYEAGTPERRVLILRAVGQRDGECADGEFPVRPPVTEPLPSCDGATQ